MRSHTSERQHPPKQHRRFHGRLTTDGFAKPIHHHSPFAQPPRAHAYCPPPTAKARPKFRQFCPHPTIGNSTFLDTHQRLARTTPPTLAPVIEKAAKIEHRRRRSSLIIFYVRFPLFPPVQISAAPCGSPKITEKSALISVQKHVHPRH